MARRPALITQADVARALRAAKQIGASEVVLRIGDRDAIIIRIAPSTGTQPPALEETSEIVL